MQQTLDEAMKEGMRRLASGVSVITCQNAEGERYAMTASSVTSVSDAPPSLLVCINKTAKICQELQMGQIFAVNVLTQLQKDVSIQCSTGAKGQKRFAVGTWLTSGLAPKLEGAEVVFECMVDALLPYGTHNIVVGKITQVDVSKTDLDPLVYLNGAYRKVNL